MSKVYQEYFMKSITSHTGKRTGSGHPHLLNYRDQRRLSGKVPANRRSTLIATFNEGSTKKISKRTVQMNLALTGYSSRRPTLVSLLTVDHPRKNLTWTSNPMDLTLNDCRKAAGSSESHFQFLQADGCVQRSGVWGYAYNLWIRHCLNWLWFNNGVEKCFPGMNWTFYLNWIGH